MLFFSTYIPSYSFLNSGHLWWFILMSHRSCLIKRHCVQCVFDSILPSRVYQGCSFHRTAAVSSVKKKNNHRITQGASIVSNFRFIYRSLYYERPKKRPHSFRPKVRDLWWVDGDCSSDLSSSNLHPRHTNSPFSFLTISSLSLSLSHTHSHTHTRPLLSH